MRIERKCEGIGDVEGFSNKETVLRRAKSDSTFQRSTFAFITKFFFQDTSTSPSDLGFVKMSCDGFELPLFSLLLFTRATTVVIIHGTAEAIITIQAILISKNLT